MPRGTLILAHADCLCFTFANSSLDLVFQIECSNGQVGFGRKRRAIDVSSTDKNKIFEVTMSTFIKVDFEEDAVVDKGKSFIVSFAIV